MACTTAYHSRVTAMLLMWLHDRRLMKNGRLADPSIEPGGKSSHKRKTHEARAIRAIDFEKCFDQLSKEQQEALLLVHSEGASAANVAEIHGVAPTVAARFITRAMDKLGDLLEERNLL